MGVSAVHLEPIICLGDMVCRRMLIGNFLFSNFAYVGPRAKVLVSIETDRAAAYLALAPRIKKPQLHTFNNRKKPRRPEYT